MYIENLQLKEQCDNIYESLKSITIPKLSKTSKNLRLALPDKSRSSVFGYVLKRIGKKFELSSFTHKYPNC